jgi:hypothetical protein
MRPFVYSKLVPFPQVKCLHDNAVVTSESEEDSSPVDQPKSEAQNDTPHAKLTKEQPNLANDKGTATPRYRQGHHPGSVAAREKRNEEQRALGWPNLKAASEKVLEEQRAASFPNLQEAREIERAKGFPVSKANREELRASDYREAREAYRVELLRDIEATNERKLAVDPTFKPLPIPNLMSKPRREQTRGHIPCPEPGCERMFKHEKSLKEHMRRYHGGYSKETPHKCKLASCNQYYETEAKAKSHFHSAHQREKARRTWCDREMTAIHMPRHLFYVHGQPMDTVPK